MNDTASITEVVWFLICALGVVPGLILLMAARKDAHAIRENNKHLTAEERYLARSAAIGLAATGLLILGVLLPFSLVGLFAMFRPSNPGGTAPSVVAYVFTMSLLAGVAALSAMSAFLLTNRAEATGYIRGLVDGRQSVAGERESTAS